MECKPRGGRISARRWAFSAALAAATWWASGCACPHVNVEKYFPRDTPAGAVRYFQLSLELEMWSEAAACLASSQEEIGSWKLWALCDRNVAELGDFSLRQVVTEVYWLKEERVGPGEAVVSVLSRPVPTVDQLYHLALRSHDGVWRIDLDATLKLNV
jgi:hypothetical protein